MPGTVPKARWCGSAPRGIVDVMTLDPSDVDAALAELEGWTNDGDALTKTFTFADFAAAMGFMQRAAGPIDEADHHPEWTNVYNRVDVRLSSHDAGGITDRDLALAKSLDSLENP